MAKKSTAVTTTSENPLANLSAELQGLLAENADQGLENVGAEGFALPFLKLLQSLSPEVEEGEDSYVEGARPGLILDSVTREIFPAVEVIPVHIRSAVIEWAPRSQGGGFIAEYANREEAEDNVTPGNELKDTITYTVLYRPEGREHFGGAVLSMDSTKLKIARSWNTQLSMMKVPIEVNGEVQRVSPPIFMTRWLLSAAKQENAKGRFYNFAVRSLGLVEDTSTVETAQQIRASVEGRPLRGKNGDLPEPVVGEGADTSY